MYPTALALIDDDPEFADYLAQDLRRRGISVDVFSDSNALLAGRNIDYDFYIVDLMLPGVDGVQLIDILRRRTDAGILVVSGRLGPEVFASVMRAGADMHLVKPVQFDQVALALTAVYRRSAAASSGPGVPGWRLERGSRELVAPDGVRISLSEADMAVMECFVSAAGATVSREMLRERVGHIEAGVAADSLNAAIYRLRRRIERATPHLAPLQSRSRVGYVFRAPLTAA